MKATIRLKLHMDPASEVALKETMRQFTACFNAVCRHGWEAGERNGIRLHHATYPDLRQRFDRLPSQLVVSSRMKAAETLKSVEERRKQGRKVSCPHSDLCPIRYDARSYWITLSSGSASLTTVCRRVSVTFQVPTYCLPYADWKPCSADLCLHQGVFFLHVVVEASAPEPTCEGVLGVDLGITEIAVDSDANSYSGETVKSVRRRVKRIRRLLQKRGTKSARRHLRKIARKQSRFVRDVNHVVSKSLVRSASHSHKALALEELTHIRDRADTVSREMRWLLGNWAFLQLRQFIEYKAQAKGVPVLLVDPRNTSRTCSRCGYCDKANRRSQSKFQCLQCGLTLNADFNGALNVKTRAENEAKVPAPNTPSSVRRPIVSSGSPGFPSGASSQTSVGGI